MRWLRIMVLLCLGIMLSSVAVLGANQNVSQENVTTSLDIYDSPSFDSVTLEDDDTAVANELDLTPATLTTINCSAYVTDLDGEGDIDAANATLYLQSTGHVAADDPQNHYTNSSCAIDTLYGDGNQVEVECLFTVQFYATGGTWECNMSVNDSQSLEQDSTDTSSLTDLLALDVANGNMDFGNLGIGDDTGTADVSKVITNNGNVALTLKLNTFGTTLNDARSMSCASGYTEPDDLRVDTSATQAYGGRTQLASTNDDGTALGGFTVSAQTSGSSGTTGSLYFGMGVSSSGSPAGSCTGNVMFTGVGA